MRSMSFIQNAFCVLLFAWISFIPLPLQCRYPLQLKIFFLAGFAFLCIKNRRSVFRNGDWPLWLFLAAMSFSIYGAAAPEVATTTFLDLSLPMLFIYYLITENFSSKENFVFFTRIICVFSLVVAFWGFLDCLLGVNFLYEEFFKNPFYDRYKWGFPLRAIATQFHSPPLGTYLIASLPFSFLTMRQDRSLYKVLGVLGVIMTVTVSILTFSRGVFLSLSCMVLFVLFIKKKAKWILFLLLGLATFMVVSAHLSGPFSKFGNDLFFTSGDGVFTSYRFERLQALGRILKAHPFFGIGFQHVRLLFYYYFPGRRIETYEFRIMDNMYLTIAAETGIVGITAFLVFIGSVILKAWRGLAKLKDDTIQRTRLFCVLTGFLGLLVNAAAYELFYWPSQYMFFCIYIGLIEALCQGSFVPAQGFVRGKPETGSSVRGLGQFAAK